MPAGHDNIVLLHYAVLRDRVECKQTERVLSSKFTPKDRKKKSSFEFSFHNKKPVNNFRSRNHFNKSIWQTNFTRDFFNLFFHNKISHSQTSIEKFVNEKIDATDPGDLIH